MVNQYFDGILPQPSIEEDIDKELKDMATPFMKKLLTLTTICYTRSFERNMELD